MTTPPADRMHGSYHWDLERGASLALVPIIGAQLALGASPVTDTLLGVVLPLHIHIGKAPYTNHRPIRYLLFRSVVTLPTIGFDSCITGTETHEAVEIKPTDSLFFLF